ncbi:hypothetical protein [Halodesulfurarchaeum sp.]|uniref:hypothetical protein n=1 Tax=Halodesulfurarchaeum sp. TaxID=1980530 RepID=UPI002FC32545
MDRQSTNSQTDVITGTSVGLGICIVALILLLAAIVVGFGPVMALAPSPDPNSEHWVQIESIDADPANETATTVTLTYRIGGSDTGSAPPGTHQYAVTGVDPIHVDAAGDWAYLSKSSLPSSLVMAAGNHSAGVEAVGPWVLVGNLSTATEVVRTAPVTVGAPAAMDVDPARKAHFLSLLVSPYQLHQDRAEPATILIAPDALPYDGVTYGTRSYITQHAFWDGDATSVWIHEYLHSQQRFETAPEMEWFREASATYLAARMLEEQYHEVEPEDVRAWIMARDDSAGTALADESTWDRSNANYYRGARLLYAADAAIREGSGGKHCLVDVFREMNARKEPVTLDEFVHIVESFSGRSEPWLREAITGTGTLEGRVSDPEAVFAE